MSLFIDATPGKLGVLYNDCYGGFWLSEKAVNMYKNRRNIQNYISGHAVSRTDPVLIDIYNEIGREEFSQNGISSIEIKYIDPKYENFYTIIEYDGLEDIEILYENYKLYMIKDISYDKCMSNEEKITKIKELFEK